MRYAAGAYCGTLIFLFIFGATKYKMYICGQIYSCTLNLSDFCIKQTPDQIAEIVLLRYRIVVLFARDSGGKTIG